MPLITRALLVAVLLIPLPIRPAVAAPAEATAGPHLGQITLAPHGPERNTILWLRTQNAEPGAESRLEVTVDLGGAAEFADVKIDDSPLTVEMEQAPARPSPPCRIADGKITCSWTTIFDSPASLQVAALLAVSPKPTAKVGDSADIVLTAQVGEGPVTTSSSMIRVGAGVDLTTDADRELKAAAGRPVKITPTVRNAGATVVDGVALVIDVAPQLLGDSSFRNCRYGIGLICTFDTELEAGQTYTLSSPVVVQSPTDTVPGSVAQMAGEWMTRAEWDDAGWGEYGTAGTGGLLTLEPKATSQADPQADVEPGDNLSTTKFTVTGTRAPSLAAIGLRRTATAGTSIVLSPGMANFGPGTLRPDLFANNRLWITVRLPGNVAGGDSEVCFAGETDRVLFCPLGQRLGPGQRATFRILTEVTDGCGAAGSVEVPGRLLDPDGDPEGALPKKIMNTTSISVIVPGARCATVALPITGPAGWTALLGAMMLALGLAAVWLSTGTAIAFRRRPQGGK